MAALTTIASIAAIAGSIGGLAQGFKKPKSSKGAAQELGAETADQKRKRALQREQRKPTETFLTGGQGLGQAQGSTLG